MKIDVPKYLYDDWARDWPGTTIVRLQLKNQREQLLLLTICGKPEAFIRHHTLVDPMQYARTQGGAKVSTEFGWTWIRAGLFYADLYCSPKIKAGMWKILWGETLGKMATPPVQPTAKCLDRFWQDEPREYGSARPWDSWFA